MAERVAAEEYVSNQNMWLTKLPSADAPLSGSSTPLEKLVRRRRGIQRLCRFAGEIEIDRIFRWNTSRLDSTLLRRLDVPDYRRWFIPGGTYFFTLVTYRRRQFLTDEIPRRCLREAIAEVRKKMPFEVVGIVLLPDHLHMVVSLPTGERHYSTRLRRIKESFTESFLASGGTELPVSESRRKRGERGIWQRRFWEHTVRDEDDLQRCVDYVHWNPRKHGLVDRVRDWPYSTFHRFVAAGEYDIDWGGSNPFPTDDETVWGE